MGAKVSEETARLFAENRYQDYLLLHGLGVELAEALAEYWHARIRAEWGFGDEDGAGLLGLFRQEFRGGRYSWGYPACPDLEDNAQVAELLDAHRIGVNCSEDTSLAVPARADHLGHHLPPPPGQVLRRPLTSAPSAGGPGAATYASAVRAGPAPAGRTSLGRARPA